MPGELLFGWLDDTLLPTLATAIANLAALIAPVMGAWVVFSFVIWAIRYIKDQGPITELLWRHFVLMCVAVFVANVDYYLATIVPMVNALPADIAGAFSASSEQVQVSNIVDDMIISDAQIISAIWEETKTITFTGIKIDNIFNATRATAIISVLGGIYIAISFFLLFIAKLVVNVLLALGPIFICCAFFEPVKNYFTLWVNQIVNYLLLSILFSVVFSLQHTLVKDIVEIDPDTGGLTDLVAAQLFVIYLVCIGTITIIPILASSLSGGMGMNGVVGNMANTATMFVSKPMAAAMKGGGGGSNLGRNRMTPNSNRRPG